MSGVGEGIQSKQLQQQNERLKEAVMKLRDLSNREKQECQKLMKDVEGFKQEIEDLTKRNEKLLAENRTHDEQLAELRDQVSHGFTDGNLFLFLSTPRITPDQ